MRTVTAKVPEELNTRLENLVKLSDRKKAISLERL